MKKSPCYNEKTLTDCPKRTSGCHAVCKEWAEYIYERDEEYRIRAANHDRRDNMFTAARTRYNNSKPRKSKWR